MMKFTTILTATLIACSSTKKTVENNPKSNNETIVVIADTIEKKVSSIKDTVVIAEIIEQKEETLTDPNKQIESIPLKKEVVDHSVFNKLLQENVSENGNVNYKGFINNKSVFNTYLKTLETNLPEDNWTHNDKLAYWMNVYNAFTIKLIIDNYPTNSIKDIKDAWDARFFKLGKKWYNLNEVEHKILRKMGDARIHFGINCASFSCPPILNKAFTAANVDQELDFLAKRFINDTQRNKISSDRIQLSKIFQWFGKDFKTQGSLIDYLNKYSDIKINSNAKKSYLKYNWDLNE
ncbi:DUF547 domain-containing protein [Pseudofulvibacter geojedonensis]|uniref:DUF547 domain-containing protein n=1 Tax=Pseudofulvibacter geojedonensis TaxID=1123758 RepID=A0ABW3I177_9FLAO